MKTANFNQKNTKYTPTRYFLSRHLGHLKPPRTFLTRHLFIDGHLLPSGYSADNIIYRWPQPQTEVTDCIFVVTWNVYFVYFFIFFLFAYVCTYVYV